MANSSQGRPETFAKQQSRRPPTTQEAVLEELRRAIASGALLPGERLYQDALADQMGVSRVPVREALNVLRADGLLEYFPHKGYRVSTLSEEEVYEINLIRGLLEGEAIRLAVAHVDDDFIDHLRSLNQMMAEAHDEHELARFISLNHDFHFALFDLAGLPRLKKHIDALWKSADPYRRSVFGSDSARADMLVEHEALIEACEAKDVAKAIRVMDDHRSRAVNALSSLLGDQMGPLSDSNS